MEKLEAYAATRDSYIEEFWVCFPWALNGKTTKKRCKDESYLNQAEPVVLSLNPFFILQYGALEIHKQSTDSKLRDDPTPSRGSQLLRASSLILSSLGFIHDLRMGVLEPDDMRGIKLDMTQYTRLFGTARIPTECVSLIFS